MSRALDMLLDPARLAECAKNDKALMVDRAPPVWMRPQPMTPVMAIRARGLGLLAENDEPESLVAPRFPMTYCSQCGEELGPGDAGVSHCDEHTSEADALVMQQGFIGGLPA